jgi:N-hydroxyarylamine O-acetyltransferase
MNSLESHLPKYLKRVDLAALPPVTATGLNTLVVAQTRALTFENLDVLAGVPISIAPEAIIEKILVRGRGGYCFELNGLLALALETAGFMATPKLARVVFGRESPGPKTHICYRVKVAGETFLVDAGFGGPGLVAPLPWVLDTDLTTDGTVFRLRAQTGGDVRLERKILGVWTGLYLICAEEVRPIDLEMSNHFVSQWERSPFRSVLFGAIQTAPGLLIFRGPDLLEFDPELRPVRTTAVTSAEQLQEILNSRFKITIPLELTQAAWKNVRLVP